jgi:O-antigen ligase
VAVFALAIVRAAQVSDGRFRAILPLLLTLAVLGAAVLVPVMGGAELIGKSSDLSGRTEIWEFAASMVERRPWLGYGYKVFWLGSDAPAAAFWKASSNFVPHAHNGFLELALDLGLIGLSLSLAAVIGLAVKIGRLLRHYPDICLFWVVGFISFDLVVNVGEVRLWEPNELHTLLFVYVVVRTNVDFASFSARARVIRTGLPGSPASGSFAV